MHNSAETIVSSAPTEVYPVGYKRPPKEHQFKKGQSGNPKGRPKTISKETLYEEEVRRLAHAEAYRMVSVREGDRTVQMPVIKAAIRTMLMKGLQGNAKLLCRILDLLAEIEGDRRSEQLEMLKNTWEYKEHARREREKCAAEGKSAPKFVVDPDQIEIDFAEGTIKVRGPATREEKESHRLLSEMKKEWDDKIIELDAMLKEAPDDAFLLDDLAFARKMQKKLSSKGFRG